MRTTVHTISLLVLLTASVALITPHTGAAPATTQWKCTPSQTAAQSLPTLWLNQALPVAPHQGTLKTAADTVTTYFRHSARGRVWYWRTALGRSYAFLIDPDGQGHYYDFSRAHFFSQPARNQPHYSCRKHTP